MYSRELPDTHKGALQVMLRLFCFYAIYFYIPKKSASFVYVCTHSYKRDIKYICLYTTHIKCHIIHINGGVFSMNSLYLVYAPPAPTHGAALGGVEWFVAVQLLVVSCFFTPPPPCPAPAPHGHGSDIIIYWFKWHLVPQLSYQGQNKCVQPMRCSQLHTPR